ncbi:type II toxin-antitoxin system RelE family toxin [Fusobacterium hwasookii]|uniref:Addiction module toxin RelE n=1 Tax=Fusobacterium hwasookii ChDC F206 TaxID=1307443 RepID=A0AAC9A189_9FUSO|nr:type II toxin-antitoxin system RelE/ParE family toxin [Fusobacterium hwasookii]ALQ35434.1 addiction module toxin RelE [Fusobacterium hwasookii ChDC F206]
MKKYKVKFSDTVVKELKKLDKLTTTMKKLWLIQNLENTINPRQHGKSLTANYSGKWRYRVGNYRLLAEIYDDEILILIFKVEHRSIMYKK